MAVSQHEAVAAAISAGRAVDEPSDIVADRVLEALEQAGYVAVGREELHDVVGDHCPSHARPTPDTCSHCALAAYATEPDGG